jgi:hypothetical protein
MIIIENEYAGVLRINCSADSRVTWAQITILNILWNSLMFVRNGFAAPGAILSMRSNDYPLFPKWMPAFLPDSTRF